MEPKLPSRHIEVLAKCGEAHVAFNINYEMLTGTGRRQADTPDEALEMLLALELAGAGVVSIEDQEGKVYHHTTC